MNKLNLAWLQAAIIRSIRTIAQTAVSMLTLGAAINEVNWMTIVSVSVVAGVYSLLTSIATGLPEVSTDGTLLIDTKGATDIYRLQLDTELTKLAAMKHVSFKVDATADLSQE